jgi:two-component sensor histidine kinase
MFKPNLFTNYISSSNLHKFIPNSIVQQNKSKIIVGSVEGLTDLNNNRLLINNQLTHNNILSLAVDNLNKLFIGTLRGFNILTNNAVEKYFLGNKANNGIYDIDISYEGDVLLAVRRKGIVVFTPDEQKNKNFIESFNYSSTALIQEKVTGGTLSYITMNNGLQNTFILDILTRRDSTIVIGYQGGGASFYKNGVFTHINKDDGLTDGVVTTIFEDDDGTLWFGTRSGGISIYQNGNFDTINVSNGLSSNDIRGILKYDDNVYVSTAKGLNVIVNYPNDFFVRKLYQDDGLASNNCNRNAFLLDNDNNIFIGTSMGLSKYNPKSDKLNTLPPKIYITRMEIFNEEYPIENIINAIQLNYDQNYLKFIYSGINLSSPEKIKYKYHLIGIDKDWVETDETYSNYTNLDDGEYIFEIKARNEWGYWSEPASLSFTINPAWWETLWFYSILILLIGSLIAFIASYRYRNLLAIERIRTKISTDLHDSIGSGLTEITIVSELLNTQQNANIDDLKNGLKNISITARSLVGNMSDIVWLVNPKKDSLKDLLLRLQDSYQEVLAQANVSFQINNIEHLEETRLTMTFRQHLFLLFKEAINNALKYSKCTELILDIKQIGDDLKLSLKDNGIGFNLESESSGNGLINMKERANAINGNLEIISKLNEGTILNFSGKI